jgi:ariadne-1
MRCECAHGIADHPEHLSHHQAALVQILLLQNRWDTDKVIERFLSSREDTLRAAGEPASVIEPSSPQPPPAKRARVSEPEFTCEICFDTPGADGAFALRCAHRFCTGCWEAYLGAAVRDEGRCLITCMSAGCKTVVDAPALARLADAQTHER